MERGRSKTAAVAGPPSPTEPLSDGVGPPPATVAMIPSRCYFANPIVAVIGDEDVARGVHCDTGRGV
jgi:hypothetical protein